MAGTTKKKVDSPAATRNVRAKRAGPTPTSDRYNAENIGANATLVQGKYNKVQVQHITYVYGNTPLSVEQEADLDRLEEHVPQTLAKLQTAIAQKRPASGNPYHLLEALNVHEQAHLAGRTSMIEELSNRMESKRLAALFGENGIGKTSLLRAGLIPALAAQGHWPIWIEATREPLESSIKKQVLGSLDSFPILSKHSLKDVLHLASAFLPHERGAIVLLLDNLEEFFEQPDEAQAQFAQQWKECMNDAGLDVRWLFCMAGLTHRLNLFQSGEVYPFGAKSILGPLDREAVRQAILVPAGEAGIHFEGALIEKLVEELGKAEVTPTQLQIVCHTLAAGKRRVLLSDYASAQGVKGILQNYLKHALEELPEPQRDPAWQILSILEHAHKPMPEAQISRELAALGQRQATTLLEQLMTKRLITLSDMGYRLASDDMKQSIQEWRTNEAVSRQIQKALAQQLEQVRNSVLRGLLGGAAGLGLFRLIVGNPIRDPIAAVFLTLLYATIGGLIGLMLTLAIDISSAPFLKVRTTTRYIIGALGGTLTFALALTLFTYLSIPSENPLITSLLSMVEGGLWGLAAGVGITWGMNTTRPAWLVILSVPIACGVVLALADGFLSILTNSAPLQIAAGGLVFPLLITIGARLGRRQTGGES